MDVDTFEPRRGRRRKPFDKERAIRLRDAGFSLRQIAAELSTSEAKVSTMKVQRELESLAPPLLRTTPGLQVD
jgi:hypothetical protein